jgi:hypothetical protein
MIARGCADLVAEHFYARADELLSGSVNVGFWPFSTYCAAT